LTYSDRDYRNAKVSYESKRAAAAAPERTGYFLKPATGRQLMAPVKFANGCVACHLLTFDKRFDFGVPHDEPEVVHAFLVGKFTQYIESHAGELREARDPRVDLAGKPLPPEARTYTQREWIAQRVFDAEQLLWRKTCSQCHALSFRWEGPGPLPRVAPWLETTPAEILTRPVFPEIFAASDSQRRMPHAKFDHDAHRGFSCESCHAKALTSTETTDVLLPGIATCQKCHAPGPEKAESRCFECHTYHNWAMRKEVTPRFTLPALRTGGK
jgi:hypothetical protein